MKLFGSSKGGKWSGQAEERGRFYAEDPAQPFEMPQRAEASQEQDVEPIIRSVISRTQEDLTADQPVAVRRPKLTLPEEEPETPPATVRSQQPRAAFAAPQTPAEPPRRVQSEAYDEDEALAERQPGGGLVGWAKGLLLLAGCLAIFLLILILVGNQLMSQTALAQAVALLG